MLGFMGEAGTEADRLQLQEDENVIQANPQTLKIWRKTGVMASLCA